MRVQEIKRMMESEEAHRRTEKLLRSKETFFTMMSSELRSPLTAVIGMANLLSKTRLTAQQKECTESILFSGKNMLQVVDNILDFSQLEAETFVLEKSRFNLRECIEKVCRQVELIAEDKNIELIIHIDRRVPGFIVGDSNRLAQILLNLLLNAIKFTQVGHVLLKCAVCPERKGIMLEIEDTGMGIPPDEIQSLFEPFAQAVVAGAKRGGGSGLGLLRRSHKRQHCF